MFLKINNILKDGEYILDYHGLNVEYFDIPIYFDKENFVVIKYNAESFKVDSDVLEITEQQYMNYKAEKENEQLNSNPPVPTYQERIEQLEKENTTIKASMAELAELVLTGGM